MSSLFRIIMLPAEEGDCLVIEYGDPGKVQRILVDTGTTDTCKAIVKYLGDLPENQRRVELLILSHVDDDHIGGLMKLIKTNVPGLTFGDIWFNGWRHLPKPGVEKLGPVQGERLTEWLLQNKQPWNKRFNGGRIAVPNSGSLPSRSLEGGMNLTILSPGNKELSALRPKWEKLCRQAGLDPAKEPPAKPVTPPGFEVMGAVDIDDLASEPFRSDPSESNGSSIALLAEYDGRSLLLAGDAFSTVMQKNIDRLLNKKKDTLLKLDAMKLAHHGSKRNTSRALLEKLNCPRYLISTNGDTHQHPDAAAVARTIKFSKAPAELMFNYRTQYNDLWDDQGWMEEYHYQVRYPKTGKAGFTVEL